MSVKQAINDKLQGTVATCLRFGGVINNQIKKGLLVTLWVKKLKSANISQSRKQKRDWLVHFLRLLAVCWPGASVLERLPSSARRKDRCSVVIDPIFSGSEPRVVGSSWRSFPV